jgi:hypothetical protein
MLYLLELINEFIEGIDLSKICANYNKFSTFYILTILRLRWAILEPFSVTFSLRF